MVHYFVISAIGMSSSPHVNKTAEGHDQGQGHGLESSSFATRRMIGVLENVLLCLKFWAKVTDSLQKRRLSIDIRS